VKHGIRGAMIVVGWYLAQSFSRMPESLVVNATALVIVTAGVAMVGWACYAAGVDVGRGSRA
jgi:hypothetical protein